MNSNKQDPVKICLINDKIMKYDFCLSQKRDYLRGDIEYLGEGQVFSVDSVTQKPGDCLHFYKYKVLEDEQFSPKK